MSPAVSAMSTISDGLVLAAGPVALACSFSLEDIALIDLAARLRLDGTGSQAGHDVSIFALDTGRLPEETYQAANAVQERFGVAIEWLVPSSLPLESLLRRSGPLAFRDSLGDRHACCDVRKVEPLSRALVGKAGWITGQRREQSVTRGELMPIERDQAHGGIIKINPLWQWTDEQVWTYVRDRKLPVHALYARGYASIGCAPCTRAISPGAHPRSGRWWWESEEHKECGLHRR